MQGWRWLAACDVAFRPWAAAQNGLLQLVCPALPRPSARSKPMVWAKSTGALTWNVSVTPNTTTPLFSYPEGGWMYYSILVQQGGSSKTFKCA